MDDSDLAAVLSWCEPVAAAWLFGSVARGDARDDSDLDIGVVFRDPSSTAKDHRRALYDLASRLETFGRLVDVVDLQAQGPVFCHRVLTEGRLVYEADRERRIDFVSDTIVGYLDWKPVWDRAHVGAVDALKRWAQGHR